LESQAHEISLVLVLHPSFVEHDDVHDISDTDIFVTNRERSPSALPQLTATQTAVQIDNSEVQTATTSVHDDTEVLIAKDQHIQQVHISSTLGQHQEVHNNKNIHHDLELWARIREYDQRTMEGCTQLLTKKHKQIVKKTSLGKVTLQNSCKGCSSCICSMNLLYWNVRGISNSDTRIALKTLLLSHKSLLVFSGLPNYIFP
jgi:hypothetical protein